MINHECHDEIPEEFNALLQELHCSACGRFLCFQAIVEGTIAVKCRRCKEWNVLDVRGLDSSGKAMVKSSLKVKKVS